MRKPNSPLNLQEASDIWKSMERKTAVQRKKAEDYYAANVMGLIEGRFIENNKDKVYEPVDYLIQSVGTSYEPLVLSIQLLKPKKILFLYTKITKPIIDKLVSYCGLSISDIEMEKVNETDPIDIYRKIKEIYLEWNRPEKLYIDITGGTKSMSAAAAMAGSMIDVQLIYVGTNNYLVDFRKPDPGSETLYFISNPLAIFGDLEIEKAFALFAQYNYSGAREKLEMLKEKVPDPELRQQLQFTYLLARAYEYWDMLSFENAYSYMDMLVNQLERDSRIHRTFIIMDFLPVLNYQKRILENMQKIPALIKEKRQQEIFNDINCMEALMFTLYQNAYVRQEQEKYDMGTLLLYRLLEMIEQKRLANLGLNISHMVYKNIPYAKCGLPDIEKIPENERMKWLKEEMLIVKQQLFRNVERVYLQEQVSLLDGFCLLYVLNDPIICKGKNIHGIDKLKRIRSMIFLRNNSIFAHGLGPVSQKEFTAFKEFVVGIFREFCELEKIPFNELEENIRWLNPAASRYYGKLV